MPPTTTNPSRLHGAGCARRARRRLAAPRPHRYGPPRAGSPPPLTARRRVSASGTPPGTRRRAPRGSAALCGVVRCGAMRGSLPRRSPQVGRGGQGAASPPPRPRPPFSIARVALGVRSGVVGGLEMWMGSGWRAAGDGERKGEMPKGKRGGGCCAWEGCAETPLSPLGCGGMPGGGTNAGGGCEGSPAEGPGDCSQAQCGSGQPPGMLQSPKLVAFWSPGRGCQGAGIGVLWEQGAARGRQGCEPPKSCVLRGEAATTPRGAPVCCGAGGPGGQVGSVGWAVLSLYPTVSQLAGVPRSWHTARPLLLLGSCR